MSLGFKRLIQWSIWLRGFFSNTATGNISCIAIARRILVRSLFIRVLFVVMWPYLEHGISGLWWQKQDHVVGD